jgi:Beta-galactosidase, domain 3/Beta-galactosidase, domain 2
MFVQIFTWFTIGGIDHVVLYAQLDHPIEVMITGPSRKPPVTRHISESSTIQVAILDEGILLISGKPSGLSVVDFGHSKIFVVDKQTALSFWNVRLSNEITTTYDSSPDTPSIVVIGPYLVRNATIGNSGSQLMLYGDINATTSLEIIAPRSVQSVIWNDKRIEFYRTKSGTMRGELSFDFKEYSLPSLKEAEWTCTDSLPEILAGFDDSDWVSANKTETARPFKPYGGKVSTPNLAVGLLMKNIAKVCALRR